MEFDELWEWDIEINRLRPILEPLTIITNIISKDGNDIVIKFMVKEK